MLHIYIPQDNIIGEKNNILVKGLKNITNIEITNDIINCDYIIITSQDNLHNFEKFITSNIELTKKLIFLDYTDDTHLIYNLPYKYYFKRSVVDKINSKLINYDKPVIPIAYTIKQECLDNEEFKNVMNYTRLVDFSCFFEPNTVHKQNYNYNRNNVAKYLNTKFLNTNYNYHIGYIGKNGEIGRNSIQKTYYNKMFHSKIVITCNPTLWEGDYRLFEALSTGALVFVDKMLMPINNKLINKKHLIFYDYNNLEDLKNKIIYYLNNEVERIKIAKEGLEYVKKYHTPKSRILEILNIIENGYINNIDLKYNLNNYIYTKTWFLESELYKLYKMNKIFLNNNNNVYKILEIGSFEGLSTCFFSDILLNNCLSSIVCVDPFLGDKNNTIPHVIDNTEKLFLSNINKSKNSNKITFYKVKSNYFFDNIISPLEKYNFIYIDGSHEAKDIENDMENSFKYLEVNGIMWMDDYGGVNKKYKLHNPRIPMNIFLLKYKNSIKIIHKGYQLAIQKIK